MLIPLYIASDYHYIVYNKNEENKINYFDFVKFPIKIPNCECLICYRMPFLIFWLKQVLLSITEKIAWGSRYKYINMKERVNKNARKYLSNYHLSFLDKSKRFERNELPLTLWKNYKQKAQTECYYEQHAGAPIFSEFSVVP